MQLSDDEQNLVAALKSALTLAESMSLGFVAISISSALDHMEQALGERFHFSPGGDEGANRQI